MVMPVEYSNRAMIKREDVESGGWKIPWISNFN